MACAPGRSGGQLPCCVCQFLASTIALALGLLSATKKIGVCPNLFPHLFLSGLTFIVLIASGQAQAQIAFRAAQNASLEAGGASNITYVGTGNVATASSGNVTPTLPSHVADDLLICLVESRDNVTHSISGWNDGNPYFSDTLTNHRASIFYKKAGAAEGNPTITHTGGSNIIARCSAFRGVDTTTPFDAAAAAQTTSGDDKINTGSLTTVTAGAMLLIAGHIDDNRGEGAPFSGWGKAFYSEYNSSNDDNAIALYYLGQSIAGTTGPFQVDTDGNANSHGVLMALRPAAAAAANNLIINRPPGTTAGDVMLAAIVVTPSDAGISPPTGWTVVLDTVHNSSGGDTHLVTYVHAVSDIASEPASYSWGFSANHSGAVGGLAAFSGVDTSTPVVTAAERKEPNNRVAHDAPSIAASAADMLVTVHEYQSSSTWSPPAGTPEMTEMVDKYSDAATGDSGVSLSMNYLLLTATGATGTKTATASGNGDEGASQSIALRPSLGISCPTVASGDWSDPAVWDDSCHGSSGIPAAGDTVTINNGHTVTLNVSSPRVAGMTINNGGMLANVAGNTLNLGANSGTGTLSNSGTLSLGTGSVTLSTDYQFTGTSASTWTLNQLDVGTRALTFGSADSYTLSFASATPILNVGSVNTTNTNTAITFLFGGAAQALPVDNVRYPKVLLSGSGAKTLSGTGTFDVRGSFTLSSGPSFLAGTNNVDLYGDFTNNGGASFNGASDSGTWTFKGSALQNVNSTDILTVFPKLTLNNSFGIALNASVSIKTLLTLTSGYISTGSNILSTLADCPGSTARTNGFVDGNLRLTFPSGTTTCTYYVGSGTTYAPVSFTATASSRGTLTGSSTGNEHPQIATAGIDATKDVNRYWSLWSSGDTLPTTSYAATFSYVSGDIDVGASYSNFLVGKYTGGAWTQPTVGTRSSTSTSIATVTDSIGATMSFAIGEAGVVELPCTSTEPGLSCLCDNFGRSYLNPSTIYGGNWIVGNSSGSFGNPTILSNRLRLTDASTNVSTVANVPGQFPAAGNKITVEFKHYSYGSSAYSTAGNPCVSGTPCGADGIVLTLSDASITPVAGAYGGSLGYAQKTGINGFAGGWLGVGIDEWGNFANPTEGRVGGPGMRPESVTLRGSGSGSGNGSTNYPYLVTTGTIGAAAIDHALSSSASWGYLYRITVDATNYTWDGSTGTKTTLVKVERDTTGTGSSYQTLTNLDLPDIYIHNTSQANVPANWKLSLTGATGSATNIHEIGGLKVCSTYYTPPAGFGIDIDNLSPTTCPTAANGKPAITVTARDSNGNTVTNYGNAVNLYARISSPTGAVSGTAQWTSDANNHGTWDSANKRYTFSASDFGVAKFYLTDGTAEDVYITVGENGSSLSSTATNPIQFRGTAFTISIPDSLGTGVVAGRAHLMHITRASGCGTDTTFSGAKSLDGWYSVASSHPAGATAPQICATSGGSCLPAVGSCATLSIAPPTLNASSNYMPALTFSSGAADFCLVTSDVGRYSVNLRDDSNVSQPITGSSTSLTVRPFGVVVSNVKQGTVDNSATTDGSGMPMVAGTNFGAAVTGYLWNSAGDADGNGLPDSSGNWSAITGAGIVPSYADTVTLAGASGASSYRPNPGTVGSLTGGSVAVASGTGSTSTLNYSEVGSFTLAAAPSVSYLNSGVDLSSRVAVFANPGSTAQTAWVGRFRPDHFGVTGSLVTRSDLQATEAQATPFTYMDEPMALTLQVTPYTAGDTVTETVTYNYAATGYAKLDAATLGTGANWFNTGCAATTQCMGLGAVNNAATGLSGRLAVDTGAGSSAPSSSWSTVTGIGTFTVPVKLARGAAPDGPYDSVYLGVLPHDSDGVVVPGAASSDPHKVDLDATTGDTLASNPDGTLERKRIVPKTLPAVSPDLPTRVRYGRLRLVPTQCSPYVACTLTLVTEYWDGAQWTTNTIDSLAPLVAANVSVSSFASVGSMGAFAAGWGSIQLTPAVGSGTATVCAYLNTAAGKFVATTPACVPATTTARSYLEGNWAGTSAYDYDPNVQIIFGGSRPPSGFYYRRENF